jgi:UDPglucose--hexose-1-phosphate uridylyltransferase
LSLFRRDPVTGRWTIIMPDRSLAPRSPSPPTAAARGFCPFCPGHEAQTPPETLRIPSPGSGPPGWSVRVVPNKFPALEPDAVPAPATVGLYDRLGGFGLHEVIIESPDHSASFASYSKEQAGAVVEAWHRRYEAVSRDPRVRYVLIFRNRGSEAGASLEHPHSQIIGLPILPKLVQEEISQARRYYEWKERCVFCDMIHEETTQGVRIVAESDAFVAFTPYASRFPYEIWILPKSHQAHFLAMTAPERKELGGLLRDVLRRLDAVADRPPFNLLVHSTPRQEEESSHYHWHIEIMPRLTRVAGFEWGTGYYLNPILPEDAAKALSGARTGR